MEHLHQTPFYSGLPEEGEAERQDTDMMDDSTETVPSRSNRNDAHKHLRLWKHAQVQDTCSALRG